MLCELEVCIARRYTAEIEAATLKLSLLRIFYITQDKKSKEWQFKTK